MYTEETQSSHPKSSEALNGDLYNSPELEQFQTSLRDLKQELSRVRGLERTEILNKLQDIETIGQHFEQWMNEPSVNHNGGNGQGVKTYSKSQREEVLNLANQIQETQEFRTLTNLVCLSVY